MRGATMLAQLYAQRRRGAEKARVIEKMHQNIALADNIVELNAMTVDLGDDFYEKDGLRKRWNATETRSRANKSSGCRTSGIAGMQNRIEENLAAARAIRRN